MGQRIRVFIISDHRLFTEGIATLLSSEMGICLVGSTANTRATFENTQILASEIVVIDATSKRIDADRTIRQLKEELPNINVVVTGLDHNEIEILKFVEAGVNGYVLRDASFRELLRTIKAVHQGQTLCSPRMAATVFARITELSAKRGPQDTSPYMALTRREEEILTMIASGLCNKEIAQQLCISLSTVKNHVHNIFEKLHVHYRREAIRSAYEHGSLTESYLLPHT